MGLKSEKGLLSPGFSEDREVSLCCNPGMVQYRLEGIIFSMPKGDAQRVWFPEMLARLRSEWRETMSFAALVDLRDCLDTMLHQIRSERHISSPVFTCPKCGLRGPKAEPRVSVRAMILAARRFGIAPPAKIKALERQWSKYRDQQGLDLYGKSLLLEDLADETDECRCKPSTSTLP